jgi:uncharacterized protein YjbI with pentapeptide repeats
MRSSLENVDLSMADLRNGEFILANFYKANLQSANLRGANLTQASLEYSDLTGAILSGSKSERAAILSQSNMEGSILRNADLSGADLSKVQFWGEGATLDGANLNLADFSNAFLLGLRFIDISQNRLQGVNFDGACLAKCEFNGVDIGDYNGKPTSFEGAFLHGSKFIKTRMQQVSLNEAAIAFAPGNLELNDEELPPRIAYEKTDYAGCETDEGTICPCGCKGPCKKEEQWKMTGKFPTKWPAMKQKVGCVFSWDEVPGEYNEILKEFLIKNLEIDWAKIEKIDDGKTIKVSTGKETFSLKLNDEKTEAVLEIDGIKMDRFAAKMKNGMLNINPA